MSRILALFHTDGTAIQPKDLEIAANSMATPTTGKPKLWTELDRPNSIGLALLSQVFSPQDSLEAVHSSPNQQQVIVSDARLDNREELARQLRIPASDRESIPDGALILTAYERWGEHCPEHLLGDFAFILWDRSHRRLFCARDPIGNRPLFWYRDQRRLLVASTPTGLFALPGVERRLDPPSLARHLTFCTDPTTTPYQAIFRLPAAHFLKCSDGRPQVTPYWSPDLSPRTLSSDVEYLEAFDELFTEAVRCRLRANGDTGLFMSGGLDSTAIAATAAPLLAERGKRLSVFSSLPPPELQYPANSPQPLAEAPLIDAVASMYPNLDLHTIHDQGFEPLRDIEHSFAFSDTPIIVTSNRPWLETGLRQAASQGITVMLNGTFGNSTISYRGHTRLMGLWRGGHWRSLYGQIKALATSSGVPARHLITSHLLWPLLPPSTLHWLSRVGLSSRTPWPGHSAVSAAAIRRYGLRAPVQPPCWNRDTGTAAWRATAFDNSATRDALDTINGWRNQFGVDLRDPTGDQRIIEFCLSLPEDQFLRDGQDRSLVRRAMRGRLPPAVLNQNTKAQQAQDWFLKIAPLRERYRQDLHRLQQSETAREVLDLPRLQTLIEDWPEGRWLEPDIVGQYNIVLQRAMAAGRFILWAEDIAS